MENVNLALRLALIAEKHFVIQTSDYDACVDSLRRIVLENFEIDDVVEIDLKSCDVNFSDITKNMTTEDNTIRRITLWKNLESILLDFERKCSLLRVLDELARYGKPSAKTANNEKFQFGDQLVRRPPLCIVIPVIQNGDHMPRITPQIKSRFFFSQVYHHRENDYISSPMDEDSILQARSCLGKVFIKATVEEYVSSLFVFTRSHRLCSLAPLSSRPPLSGRENVLLLARALAVVQHTNPEEAMFVTPEHVKVAYRKVAQWLVDWETNPIFNGEVDADYRKKMEVSMLTGDWYGSEWKHVANYLEKHTSVKDERSTTGFTNMLVEDVLSSVQPPI